MKLAFPDASSVTTLNLVPPSLNVTVPDGVPPPDELTLALKVTACPDVDGFSVEVIATVLGNFTDCERVPKLVAQLTSPE